MIVRTLDQTRGTDRDVAGEGCAQPPPPPGTERHVGGGYEAAEKASEPDGAS